MLVNLRQKRLRKRPKKLGKKGSKIKESKTSKKKKKKEPPNNGKVPWIILCSLVLSLFFWCS